MPSSFFFNFAVGYAISARSFSNNATFFSGTAPHTAQQDNRWSKNIYLSSQKTQICKKGLISWPIVFYLVTVNCDMSILFCCLFLHFRRREYSSCRRRLTVTTIFLTKALFTFSFFVLVYSDNKKVVLWLSLILLRLHLPRRALW